MEGRTDFLDPDVLPSTLRRQQSRRIRPKSYNLKIARTLIFSVVNILLGLFEKPHAYLLLIPVLFVVRRV